MMETLLTVLVAILVCVYYQCAFFMVNAAGLLGIAYRDANAILFFIIWPGVTLLLLGWVGWNQWRICCLKKQ
jgi:hypothetical protein